VCTGSVVHSAGGNLVLTAAHCLAGASKMAFVPGFAGDAAPNDVWTADAVYLDPRWTTGKDPHADYAIARVNNQAGGSVESRVGLALTLGTAPPPGSHVAIMGYPSGVGGSPIGCQTSTAVTDSGYPSLACEGLVGGTSGAPWISGTTVTGLIGGLEGGGCAENVSYSAPFDDHVPQLLARAEAGGPGDTVPKDLDDSC
jgi:V8-like Glu-specific endopeptidase